MKRWLISAAVVLVLAAPSRAAIVHGTVSVDGKGAADTVIYLERVGEPPPPAATPDRVVMDQHNLSFLPGVLPVRRGTIVDFRNSDDVQHNVFTPSEAGGKFDLGTYSRGEERSVTLDHVGELVVLCNIHMEMEAHIIVLRDPSFAVTNAQGVYSISGVPPGKYSLRLWRKRWLGKPRTVDVPEIDDMVLDVPVDE